MLREAEEFATAMHESRSPGFERAEHQVAKFVDLATRTRRISEHFESEIFDGEIAHGRMLVDQRWSIADDFLKRLDADRVEDVPTGSAEPFGESSEADLERSQTVGSS